MSGVPCCLNYTFMNQLMSSSKPKTEKFDAQKSTQILAPDWTFS